MKTKNRSYSRFAALLMVFIMVFTMIPPMAFAGTSESYPFTEITTDAGAATKIEDMGTITYTGYSAYENVPYYHVTIPEGATEVYVTHPFSEDPFADESYGSAYGYAAETSGWTGSGMSFSFEKVEDGCKITLPLSVMVDTDGDWSADTEGSFVADEEGNVGYAVAVERNDYSPICFFTFEYGAAAEPEEPAAPFSSIKIGENAVATENIEYKGIFELGDYDIEESDGYNYVHKVPYYHVTVPCGTESVDVTYPADTNILNNGSNAYGYKTDLEIDAVSSATVRGTTFKNAYTKNADGTQTVKTPVTGYTFDADGNGHAITLEQDGGAYEAICLFSFIYDGINHVYVDGVCSCGAEDPNFIPKHEHAYDDGVITTKPTCNEPGVKTFTCNGCDEGTEGHSYTKEVAKTGHNYDAGVETKAATCAEEGVKTFTCQNEGCTTETEGHTKTEKINKKAHTYDEGVMDPAPTCTAAGTKTYTCDVCPAGTTGHTKTETVAKLGHDYDNPERKCPRCGDVAPEQDENGVYQLGTAEEMLWFAKKVNSGENTAVKGVITADITLDENWPGIGNGKAFTGSLDGKNHTITLNGSTFGVVANAKGTKSSYIQIKNLVTEGTVSNSAIVNNAVYVTVDHCINKATVGGKGGNNSIAGIVGSAKDGVTIQNCGNEGNVKGIDNIAGILGNGYMAGAQITNCYNKGAISGTDEVGGIAGYIQGYPATANIKNSYNSGSVTGSTKTAGIVGSLYNNTNVVNCYNSGECTYAIAGFIYNNTANITNTYYRGDLCKVSVPNVINNQAGKYYTGNRGIAVTSAEMSSGEIATALGDAFKQSCPSPVFTDQSANGHNVESGICTVCKQGNNMPVKYKVTFETSDGATVEGDSAYNAGKDYSFKVSIQEGFYAADNFTVCVNSTKVEADENDVYHVEKPNGPIYISVTGVKQYEGKVPITRPGVGDGFRVTPCDGYTDVVDSGKDYKFTVTFVDGFKAGNDFAVKVNDEVVTPDEKGVYTLEKLLKPQTITVEGVDAIPGQQTVTIGFDATVGEDKFYVTEETEEMMMDLQVEVPYFDLGLYNLQKFYYNPNCYVDENGNINGQQKAGNRETAYNVVTSMHAFIYITELYYLGYEEDLAGTGYSAHYDSDGDGKTDFEESISWAPGQGVGSSFMNLWDIGTNLNYHLNYSYPLAYEGWGSTSDQQAIEDGDLLSVHRIEGSASGSGYGLFVVNDTNNTYDVTDERDCVTVKQGETVKLTHYLATQGNNYTTAFVTVPNENLYWVEMGAEDFNIKNWERNDFGSMTAATFKTDANGEIMIDTTDIEPGVYYIGAKGGFKKGNGQAGSDGFVSQGVESGPAYFKLIVEEDALTQAKEKAKAEIESYKNADDYRDAEKAELNVEIEAAKAAIDAAESVEEVAAAVEAAKEAMDAIKTDADLKAEEDVPATPKLSIGNVASSGAIKLSWAAVPGAEEYVIQRSVGNDDNYVAYKTTTSTSFTNTAVTAGKTYYYRVKAVGAGYESDWAYEYQTCDLARPEISISNVASSGAIKLSWKAVEGADRYEIQRSVGNDDNYVAYKTTTSTSFTNTATTAGKTYYYRVRAIYDGKSSANSAWGYEYQTCDLARPEVSISNVASSGKIKLSWKAVEGADRYEIQRSVGNDDNYVAYKTTTSTSFTNTATTAGTTYYYRVRAIYDGKSSANSAWGYEYQTCDLAAPEITVSGTKNPGKIVVSWSKVSGADRYYIYRATSKTGTYSKYSSTTGTTWTNSSVTEGKTYYYKVKAVYDGKSSANSAYSNMDYAWVR